MEPMRESRAVNATKSDEICSPDLGQAVGALSVSPETRKKVRIGERLDGGSSCTSG